MSNAARRGAPPGSHVANRAAGTLAAVSTAGLACVIFAFAWIYRFNDPGGSFASLTDDHFFYLVRGWQILFGELPVRDFVDHGAPLYYYVGAAVQTLFGRGTLSEVAFSVTVLAASASAVFLLATRASHSRLLGVSAALFHILLEPRFYNYPKILVYVLAIPALWSFADRAATWRLVMVSAVTVVAFLFRHDHGVFIALAFMTLLALMRAVPWRARVKYAVQYAVLSAALLSPYLVYIQMHGGLATYFRTAAEWAERDRDRAEVVWPGLFDNPDGVSADSRTGAPVARAVATVRDNAVAWIFYAELALPLVAILLLLLSAGSLRPSWPNATTKIATVAVLGMMLNVGFLRSPLAARLADPSVPHAILIAWLPVALWHLLRRRDLLRPWFRPAARAYVARAASGALALLLLATFAIAGTDDWHRRLDKAWLTGSLTGALDRTGNVWEEIGRSFPVADAAPDDPDSTMMLVSYLRQCTQATDRVFMQHYLPQVVALAERGFAGGHADLRPGFFTSDAMQQLTIERLRRQRVPVALVGAGDGLGGFRDSFPLIARYFGERYRNAGEREFDGRFQIRLLVRQDATPTGSFAPLGWPCFR
jgi:hypothetical protein